MRLLVIATVALALLLVPAAATTTEEELATAGAFSPTGSLAEAGGYNSAELWHPATESFDRVAWLTEPRFKPTETLLSDGRVLVVGGGSWSEYVVAHFEAEVWDPATETFVPTGSLGEAREHHTATLLPDGRVLVIGGEGDNGPLASAEIWSPTDWPRSLRLPRRANGC